MLCLLLFFSTLDDLADTLIPTPTQTVDSAPVKAASDSNTLESLADTLLPTTIQKETNGNSIPESKLDSLADTLDPFSSRAPDTLDPFSSRAPAPEKTLSSPLDSLAGTLLSTPTKSMNGSSEKSFTDSSKYSPGGTYISSSTSQSVRSPSKSTLADRNLCSFCHQSIVENTRMIVDELQIFSHAGCFKCAVCHCNLGNLEAGDSLWVYRSTVNCDGCYSKLRDRWFH
ncbi:sciellin [Clupea harengus]|uniref:Sciellin n=1 Tax=Clupea harengus TaxID=7950 RepID=A0A8M1KCG7_CLUHA|nr:sciellin [Clupea harengus]XP_042561586.1 sciellin [Clupea harengus]XP_042561587.1 sciellin [Clupea harengus]XP_042561588.1 sciellin [Clupea harengus]XP_042561589.1 sciellin [Clupea harengus]XP_042561590.1 sciellin [Clupea harengus]XP_042561591.1 sciellin [Clupea harengus]XP_042561592.1 sciellin [Clupea harengus]XP_042561593.1 sciellin [Clupea harengus]XP_042561594.1 sciellin [Clupea harengus]